MKLLTKKNYLNAIRKSVGIQMFQNVLAEIDGAEKDITKNGELSCALFVSTLLMMFHLIDVNRAPHSTVLGLLKNMEASGPARMGGGPGGWKKVSVNELVEGDVIVWEDIVDASGEEHEHIGFYVGNGMAISNSLEKRVPEKHHFTYNDKRAIESCWRAPNI